MEQTTPSTQVEIGIPRPLSHIFEGQKGDSPNPISNCAFDPGTAGGFMGVQARIMSCGRQTRTRRSSQLVFHLQRSIVFVVKWWIVQADPIAYGNFYAKERSQKVISASKTNVFLPLPSCFSLVGCSKMNIVAAVFDLELHLKGLMTLWIPWFIALSWMSEVHLLLTHQAIQPCSWR